MKVIGYVRVSTDRQADEGLGLAIQEKAIRQWAKANGHRLAGICRDEGVSGTKDTAQRPGLADAVNAVCEKRAAAIVVHRMDRLARTLTVQEGILSHVWNCQGEVYSVDTGQVLRDDAEDPMRTFVRQVMGAASELERAMVVARMRAGRRHKAADGGYAYGAPGFGYRAEGGALVPEPAEQEALARMLALRAEGKSLRQIADALNGEGHQSKRGGVWHSASVGRVLNRLVVA
jgi:DNA invertase Pin-like site-specific DNA recombinase